MAVYAALFYIITDRDKEVRCINMIDKTIMVADASAMFCESRADS